MPTQYNQYQNVQITTSTPEKILIMLYDGAIKFTRMAIDRLSKGDIAGKGMYISKAHAIISELMFSLNHEVGGDITKQLERLYTFLGDEFIAANIKNDVKHLDNALKIMSNMRDTWLEAVELAKRDREGDALKSVRMQG